MHEGAALPKVIASSSGLRTTMEVKEGTKFFFRLGVSIGRTLEGDFIAGCDTRRSSEPFAQALASGLTTVGMPITLCGVCPVMTISYLVAKGHANFGLMVTASHNPPEWNGLKVFDPSGVIVDEALISSLGSQALQSDATPTMLRFDQAAELPDIYVKGLHSEFRRLGMKADGTRIAVDPGNGASSKLAGSLLEMAGADVLMINSEMDGVFRRPIEPNSQSLYRLGETVRANNCDFGIGYDGDGDRAVLADERGSVLREDMTLLASLRQLLKRVDSPFVISRASSNAFVDLSKASGRALHFSKVGERNVLIKMRETGALLGGEGSCGGVVYTELAMTRDGILASAVTAASIVEDGPISKTLRPYSRYHSYRVNVPFDRTSTDDSKLLSSLRAAFSNIECDYLDDLKFLETDGWVLVRSSKTEPVIRVIAESRSSDRARELATKFANALLRLMKGRK